MDYVSNLTPRQMEILHKITVHKYKKRPEDLITLQEYCELNDFLKGYAWKLQGERVDSPIIVGVEIDTPEFQEGRMQAIKELETLEARRVQS